MQEQCAQECIALFAQTAQCSEARCSGARVDGTATRGAVVMAELNPVPFGRRRGPRRERRHRTVPTIGAGSYFRGLVDRDLGCTGEILGHLTSVARHKHAPHLRARSALSPHTAAHSRLGGRPGGHVHTRPRDTGQSAHPLCSDARALIWCTSRCASNILGTPPGVTPRAPLSPSLSILPTRCGASRR